VPIEEEIFLPKSSDSLGGVAVAVEGEQRHYAWSEYLLTFPNILLLQPSQKSVQLYLQFRTILKISSDNFLNKHYKERPLYLVGRMFSERYWYNIVRHQTHETHVSERLNKNTKCLPYNRNKYLSTLVVLMNVKWATCLLSVFVIRRWSHEKGLWIHKCWSVIEFLNISIYFVHEFWKWFFFAERFNV